MITNSQKRQSLRIGTNLVANISAKDVKNNVVYIQDISASGAKIISKKNVALAEDNMYVQFKYNNVVYNLQCIVTRTESLSKDYQLYGIKFNYNTNSQQNNTDTNKCKLADDILREYFIL